MENNELLKRILLNMKYDNSKTLNENVNNILLKESSTVDKDYSLTLIDRPNDKKKQLTNPITLKKGQSINSDDNEIFVDYGNGISLVYNCNNKEIFTAKVTATAVSNLFNFWENSTWKNGYLEDFIKKTYCPKSSKTNDFKLTGTVGEPSSSSQATVKKVVDYTTDKKNKKKTTNKPKTTWNEKCKGTYSLSCKTPEVGQAQQCLKDQGLYNFVVDNKFGSRTRNAVYQKLGKSSFTDSDLQTICKTKEGSGNSGDDLSDFNKESEKNYDQNQGFENTTFVGDVY